MWRKTIMIIKLKVKDIMKLDLWEEYCNQSGTDLYAVADGMDKSQFVSVDVDESKLNINLNKKNE
jgi:hypothetical protein